MHITSFSEKEEILHAHEFSRFKEELPFLLLPFSSDKILDTLYTTGTTIENPIHYKYDHSFRAMEIGNIISLFETFLHNNDIEKSIDKLKLVYSAIHEMQDGVKIRKREDYLIFCIFLFYVGEKAYDYHRTAGTEYKFNSTQFLKDIDRAFILSHVKDYTSQLTKDFDLITILTLDSLGEDPKRKTIEKFQSIILHLTNFTKNDAENN